MRSLFSPFAALALTACGTMHHDMDHARADPALMPVGAPRAAAITNASGATIGTATFTPAPAGTLIRLEFSAGALTPGWHGLHIHAVGTCADNADGFRASGSHVNHSGQTGRHGLLNPLGYEEGDLPNIFAPQSGAFGAEVFSPWTAMRADGAGGAFMPLLDADGSALIIHANADDHATQPIGGAGARVGCAALTPSPAP